MEKSNREIACELSAQGMCMRDISEKLGVPYNTVYGWIRKSKGRVTDNGAINADRHLCKTCQYRASAYDRNNAGMGCNYCDLMEHSRGCSVEECDKYVKGKMLRKDRKQISVKNVR